MRRIRVRVLVRRFALWLEWRTSQWVIPKRVWRRIDAGEDVCDWLAAAELEWGENDSEICTAKTRVRFRRWLRRKGLPIEKKERQDA